MSVIPKMILDMRTLSHAYRVGIKLCDCNVVCLIMICSLTTVTYKCRDAKAGWIIQCRSKRQLDDIWTESQLAFADMDSHIDISPFRILSLLM